MPEPMRFKDPFPFRVTKSAASPDLTHIKHLAARYWYPIEFRAKVTFAIVGNLFGEVFTEANHPDYDSGNSRLLIDFVRQSPNIEHPGDLVFETDLAIQGVNTLCPGAIYFASVGWGDFESIGTGSLGGTMEGSFSLSLVFRDFTQGTVTTGGSQGITESYESGPALTWYDDLTGRVEFVVTAAGAITPFASDLNWPVEFASFPIILNDEGNPANDRIGADEGGNSVVFRPPGTRIDESFALHRMISDDGFETFIPSLSLNIVEIDRLSYNGTAPALPTWDWSDL